MRARLSSLSTSESRERSRASGAYDDPAAFQEAVGFLRRQPALPPLGADPALEGAALSHASYQGPQGGFGHEGPAGQSLSERLHSHGAFAMMMAEDISYGYANPREVEFAQHVGIEGALARAGEGGEQQQAGDPAGRDQGPGHHYPSVRGAPA